MPAHVIAFQALQRHQTQPDLVASAAHEVEMALLDLRRVVEQATTVSEALQLHALLSTLQQEAEQVASAALDMADAICLRN